MHLGPTPAKIFQEKTIPEGVRLAGLAALVQMLDLPVPVRRQMAVAGLCIGLFSQGYTRKQLVKKLFPNL